MFDAMFYLGITAMVIVVICSGSAEQTFSAVAVANCSFDVDYCNWTNGTMEEDSKIKWTHWELGRDDNGGFLRLGTGGKSNGGDKARLITPSFTAKETPTPPFACVSFRYRVFGNGNSLRLTLIDSASEVRPVELFQADSTGNIWRQKRIELLAFYERQYPWQIMIEGSLGYDGAGEIAFADVSLVDGDCFDPNRARTIDELPAVHEQMLHDDLLIYSKVLGTLISTPQFVSAIAHISTLRYYSEYREMTAQSDLIKFRKAALEQQQLVNRLVRALSPHIIYVIVTV